MGAVWKHDEAVTILTALWYGWEHAAVQTLGMLDWLPRLYYFLPILCGDDGPFRLCACANGDLPARHDMPDRPTSFPPARVVELAECDVKVLEQRPAAMRR